MARLFAAASLEYLYTTGTFTVTEPFSMSCLFYADDIATAYALMSVGDKDAADGYHSLYASGNLGGDPVSALSVSGGPAGASSTTGFSATTWHVATGVWTSAAARAAFIDGGSKGTEATNKAIANIDRAIIAANADSSPSAYLSGRVAEAAIWNAALSDDEVAVLGKRYSPLLVHPQNLIFYARLIRDQDRDIVGGLALSSNGTPEIATHPRVRYFSLPLIGAPSGAPCVTTITVTATVTVTVMV